MKFYRTQREKSHLSQTALQRLWLWSGKSLTPRIELKCEPKLYTVIFTLQTFGFMLSNIHKTVPH